MISAAIQAVFGADTTPLQEDSKKAQGIIGKLAGSIGNIVSGISFGVIIGFIKGLVDNASAINNLSERLDVSSDALQAFDYAARKVGASSEDTTKMWDKARLSIDGLLSGSEAQTAAFAKLHLTEKDLVGLSLDEQVEKITKAYKNSKDEAGAYQAITEILGKSSPRLQVALDDLANRGFAEITKTAKEAGQVIDSDSIKKMNQLGDTAEAVWKGIKVGFGQSLGAILKAGELIGQGAGALAYGSKTMTDAFVGSADAMENIKKKIEKTTDAIVKQLATQKQLSALSEFDYQQALALMSPKEKILALENKALELRTQGANAGKGTAEWAEKELKAKQLFAEAAKLSGEEDKKNAAARAASDTEEQKRKANLLKLQEDKAAAAEKQRREEEGLNKPLADQLKKLQEQGVSAEQIVVTLQARGFSEADILKTLGEQAAALNQQYSIALQIKRGDSPEQLSDRELAERMANLKRQIDEEKQTVAKGGWSMGLGVMFQADYDKANAEQARRNQFRSQYAQMGEKAFLQYSAFDEQTLRGYIRPEDQQRAQQTLSTLQSIDARLRSAGLTTFG
jgi:hypothetical protein